MVGSAITDTDGAFEMQFDQSYFQELFADRRPDFFFNVFRGDDLVKSTEDSVLWNVEAGETEIVIEADLPSEDKPFLVRGQVREQKKHPLTRVVVRAFDQDLRRETLLGETHTDEQDHYEITFIPRAEKKCVHLIVRAYTQQSSLLGESDVIFNAKQTETVDLVFQPPE